MGECMSPSAIPRWVGEAGWPIGVQAPHQPVDLWDENRQRLVPRLNPVYRRMRFEATGRHHRRKYYYARERPYRMERRCVLSFLIRSLNAGCPE